MWQPLSARLRASYDMTGNGKTVVKGGWGRYPHWRLNEELQMANRQCHQHDDLTVARSQRQQGLRHRRGQSRPERAGLHLDDRCSDRPGRSRMARSNPDETEPYTDEFMLQFERELMPNFAVRVDRRLFARAEPVPAREPQAALRGLQHPDHQSGSGARRHPSATADDPGTTITYYDYPAALAGAAFQLPVIVNDPKANQTYKTIRSRGDRSGSPSAGSSWRPTARRS